MDLMRLRFNERWILLAVVVVIAAMFGFPKMKELEMMWNARSNLRACRHNMERLAEACCVYSNENGVLPLSLRGLVPKYIPSLPNCPVAGYCTYQYVLREDKRDYTLYCSGSNHWHAGCAADEPHHPSMVAQ